jgi:tetratricopeptide (TPR) repeat protein
MEELMKIADGFLDSDTEKAMALYQQAVEEMPEDFRGYVGMARCYSRRERYDQAVENAEKALALNPEAAKAYHVLTYVSLMRKEKPEALVYAQKAYELDPDSYGSLLNYGIANFENENYGRVSEFYEKALELRPDDLGLRGGLVESYMRTGRWKMAREQAKALHDMQPSFMTRFLRLSSVIRIRSRILLSIVVLILVVPLFVGLFWFLWELMFSIPIVSVPIVLLVILDVLCAWGFYKAINTKHDNIIVVLGLSLFYITLMLLVRLAEWTATF